MLEQDATADEIAAYSETVQVMPPLPAKDELAVGTESEVGISAAEDVAAFATLAIWAVRGSEFKGSVTQAQQFDHDLPFTTLDEAATVGAAAVPRMPVVAVIMLAVKVAQKLEAAVEEAE
ncbi:hypothetical protein ETB97_003700 [Aspergillus alliaceus]|uniref:Uncharacterized protein n=1 Tax=Petromyces alliaceus TaxID=209559 RepID=A0A8H6EAE5_PETAA|nr:hypothetical protein ETB97_003700 [Aspergillus burnettii]